MIARPRGGSPLPEALRIPAWCAAFALATSGLAVVATLSVSGWSPTVLVRMAEEEELAPLARADDPDFRFVHYHGRGDGVSYYAIARDPLARGEERELFTWALDFGYLAFMPVVFAMNQWDLLYTKT